MSFELKNLHETLSNVGLWSGITEIYYDFSNSSGNLIYNKVYPTGFHFVTGNKNKFSYMAYPGLSIGHDDYPITGSNVSGYFNSSSLVRVGVKNDFNYHLFYNGITGFGQIQGWSSGKAPGLSAYTALFNLRMSDEIYGSGRTKVLWSTMDSKTGGYTVGYTDTFDVCVDWYQTGDYKKRRAVLPLGKLGKYNLMSISKQPGEAVIGAGYSAKSEPVITVGIHDVAKDTLESASITLENMATHGQGMTGKLIEKWYLGNTPFSSTDYTGYSGYVDDFVMINGGGHEENILRSVADQYFVTGTYTPPKSVVTEVRLTYADSTGAATVSIPDYSWGPNQYQVLENVPQLDGAPDIPVYEPTQAWVSGSREITSGINTGAELPVTGYTVTEHPEVKLFGGIEKLYTHRFITLFDASNIDDSFEIYVEKERVKGRFNLEADYRDEPLDDFDLGSTYSGDEVNVFANGLVQFEGVNYSQTADTYRERTIDLSGGYNQNDVVRYDEQAINPFYSGFTSNSKIELTNSSVVNRDVYFYGEKLISGLDYSGNATTIFINADRLFTTGHLYFTDCRDEVDHFTGKGSDLVKIDQAIIDEQLFLNGVRQAQNINYSLIKNTGIISTGFRAQPNVFKIFNNTNTYWNYL